MKNNLLLSLHEKAIKVLECYYKAERMAKSHQDDINQGWQHFMFSVTHSEERIRVNKAIMERMEAYYLRIIDKINTHKP